VPGDERTPGLTAPRDEGVAGLLASGEMEILGLLPRSSNYTFLARVVDPATERRTFAVYKPFAGESPLWDFPAGTLGRREVAAYVVSRELGWPTIPPTILREGPEGPGSVQLFVEFDPSQHSFTLLEGREDVFRRIALFDVVANNADRKGGHCLLASDGRVFVIDHGVCFHVAPKLRTVIWDFAGDPIEPALLADVERLAAALRNGPARASLAALLDTDEIGATIGRADQLCGAGRFPEPVGDRPFPWPAI